jgi:hypothetical protein
VSSQLLFLVAAEIILFALAEDHEQENLFVALDVVVQISEAASRPFAPSRISRSSLANPRCAFNNLAAGRIQQQIVLNPGEHFHGPVPFKTIQSFRKDRKLDEF